MAQPDLPRLERAERGHRLIVDGEPFLILGLQWGCDSCFSADLMLPLFGQAARLAANTAVLPVYWRELEPTPGTYDFGLIDARLRGAREAGLRLVLLWFATWKNASPFYAPAYIRQDAEHFPRARDRRGEPVISHCPSGEATFQRDRDALLALVGHLRAVDTPHTVIMLQIENEPGLLGTDRCYCGTCAAHFQNGGWTDRYGIMAAEAFTATQIATYIDRLADAAKHTYALPMYVNVWLGGGPGSYPGCEYPSGGAVPRVLDIFRAAAPHIDLIGPDIYRHAYRDFRELCCTYGRGQALYVAEHSSSAEGRAERNVFYAVGEHAAIGFDPWAIDEVFPRGVGVAPLVDPTDLHWAPHAYWLRDSYHAISSAMRPIIDAQGTDRLRAFIQEPGEDGGAWSRPGCDVVVTYEAADRMGRGVVIELSAREFLLAGVGIGVRFCQPGTGRAIEMQSAEFGRFEGDRWITLNPMRREADEAVGRPIFLRRPGAARIVLGY